MKTLANCTPREFLAQTNKIRKVAKDWLDKTKVLDIRKSAPVFEDGATDEQKKAAILEQAKKNLYAMLDAVLEKYPDETVSLLCLCCFIDPEDAENHSMAEFLGNIGEVLNDENVVSFFTSLASLAQMNISDSSDK